MAQIVKRKNKNGSTSYLFRVSTGYDRNGKQVTTSRTFTPPPTLTGRKLEKEVRRRADEFEQEVHNGLALDADMKLDDLIDRWFSEYIDKKCKPKTGGRISVSSATYLCGAGPHEGKPDKALAPDGLLFQFGRGGSAAGFCISGNACPPQGAATR